MENTTKVHKIVLGDRKLELREIADTLNTSEGSVFTIFSQTILQQKDRQLSGQQLMKTIQSDQKLNSGLAGLWYPYFGTSMLFCLPISRER